VRSGTLTTTSSGVFPALTPPSVPVSLATRSPSTPGVLRHYPQDAFPSLHPASHASRVPSKNTRQSSKGPQRRPCSPVIQRRMPSGTQSSADRFPLYMFEDAGPSQSRTRSSIPSPASTGRATAAQSTAAQRGANVAATYSLHSPAIPRPPSAHQPHRLKAGKTTRELGRELIQQHVRSQRLAPAPLNTPLHIKCHSVQPEDAPGVGGGVPTGLQGILDAYTRIAGDVERLTAARRRSSALVVTSPGAANTGDLVAYNTSKRTDISDTPRRDVHGDSGGGGGFGLSSLLMESAACGRACAPQPPSVQERIGRSWHEPTPKLFGLSGILQSHDSGRRGRIPLAKRRSVDTFDEGSWIYIMGSSTSSLAAKKLAVPQRALLAGSTSYLCDN
jgi:hypothetical protein